MASLKAEIDEVFKQCKGPTFSKTNCGKIRKLLESKSRWDEMKRHGINALSGGANKACKRIVNTLSHHNVQIVPVGELECFVPSIDSHGPSWVNDVLQEYPDLNDEVYDKPETLFPIGNSRKLGPRTKYRTQSGSRRKSDVYER